MTSYQGFLAAIFGLFFGSLLNVVHLRFGQWKSIATTRSHCPHCKRQLTWFELIPVVSFVALAGRCRTCKHSISWQYPIVEVVSAVVTYAVWTHHLPTDVRSFMVNVITVVLVYIFMIMALQDIVEMEVADQLFMAAFVVAILLALVAGFSVAALLGLASATVPLLLLVVISRETWMGWGDVFIAASAGLALGYPLSVVWLYLSFVIGAGWGVLLMLAGRKTRRDPVPFIPILLVSFVLTYLYGEALIRWYSR